jgi:D-3-phosphoglycerate dehydrogenase
MPSKKIIVTPPMLAQFPTLFEPLTARGVATIFNRGAYPLDEPGLIALIDDAFAAIVGLDPISARVIAACPTLRVVARNGVGMDNVDFDATNRAGVLVTAPLGANSTTVAELTLGLAIALIRRVVSHHMIFQTGEWKREQGSELEGKTLGIIGLGRIGKKVATRALAFEMRVIANDILPDHAFAEKHDILFVSFDELLAQSDFVTLHVPLTPLTQWMINPSSICQMKRGAFLINTSRGPVVDPIALASALDEGHLAGAALDVHVNEHQPARALIHRANVITTPHIGAFTREALWRTTQGAVASIVDFLDGRTPAGLMNPEVLKEAR